jgi:glycosyltransferase involved in cell wall biosynthesis
MTSNYPKISVIIPVKNSVNTIEKAIKSVIIQQYPNLEFIIIDGQSTDGTLDVINKYQKHINILISEPDNGNPEAYVKGIKNSNSEIIAFLNADDFYESEILLKAGTEFSQEPDLDIVSFRYRVITETSMIEETSLENMDFKPYKAPNSLGINARFFKKELFYKYGFPLTQDDQNRTLIANDLEYMLRFAIYEVKNKTIDYIGYNYLFHENSLTFNNNKESKLRMIEDRIFIANKFLNSQDTIPLSPEWIKSFKKSLKKNRAQLIKINLKLNDFKKALNELKVSFTEHNKIGFIYYLFKTLLRS